MYKLWLVSLNLDMTILLNPKCWDKLLMKAQSFGPVKSWQIEWIYFGSYHSTNTKVNGRKLDFANISGNTLIILIRSPNKLK